jgi:hypothetical protein
MKHLSCWVGRLILALKIGLPGLSIVAIFWNLDRRASSEARLAEFDFYGFFAFDRSIWNLQCRLSLVSWLAN